jgi:UDP-N-acetylglucosamine 3-dehydrogenase
VTYVEEVDMRKARIGVIGAGWHAVYRLVPNTRQTMKADVVALCRRNRDRLEAAKQVAGVETGYTDWREMLEREELDAVLVSTPHHAHAEPAIAALERGLHVMVEKPMALTTEDAVSMVAASRKHNRILMVGHNCRCSGLWRTARDRLASGSIGRIRQLSVTYCTDTSWFWQRERAPELVRRQTADTNRWILGSRVLQKGYWRADPERMGGGMIADIGSHVVDLLLWLADSPPAEVHALMQKAGLPVDAFFSVHATLQNDAIVSFSYGAAVSGDPPGFFGQGRLSVFGDNGLLVADWTGLNPFEPDILVTTAASTVELEPQYEDTNTAAAFVSSVVDGADNLSPGQEGVYSVSLVEAAYQSVAEKRTVPISFSSPMG